MKRFDDNEFDNMIREAIGPEFEPGEDLNRNVIYEGAKLKIGEGKKAHVRKGLKASPALIALLMTVIIGGSVGAMAASGVFNGLFVTEHGITVGDGSYVNDDDLANIDPTETASPGYVTTYTHYDTYEEAREALGIGFEFTEVYEPKWEIECSVTEGPDLEIKGIGGFFRYGSGEFYLYYDEMTGNIAEDCNNTVIVNGTDNVREYVSSSGYTYTLVDESTAEVPTTYVVIPFENRSITGYLRFTGLSDEEIHEILDTLIMEEN